MNLTITNTDELTVYILFASAAIFLLSIAILIYCCVLMFDTRHKLKQWGKPERARDGNGRPLFERN